MKPGWYPDPTGRFEHRYFNGVTWTGDVATDGRRMVDAYADASATPGGNGLATAALVCGIVAAVFGALIFLFVVAAPLGVVAVVFSLIGLRRASRVGSGRRAAIAGLVLGAAALALSAIGVVVSWDELVDAYRRARDTIDVGRYALQIDECTPTGATVHVEGRLSNESHAAKAYRIEIEVRTRDVADTVRTETRIERLGPGATSPFSVDIPIDAPPEGVHCVATGVRLG